MFNIDQLIGDVKNTAEWRREKADEFPEDGERNRIAAECLERVAPDLKNLEGSILYRNVATLFDDEKTCLRVCEEWKELLRQVGFYSFPETGQALLTKLLTCCKN